MDVAQHCGMAAGGLDAQNKTFERYLLFIMNRWKRIFFSQQEQADIGIISPGKKVVDSPALDTFELDQVLDHLYTVLLPSKVGPDDACGPFQPGVLWFCDNLLLQWNC